MSNNDKKEVCDTCDTCGTVRISTPYYCIFCSAPHDLQDIGAFGSDKEYVLALENYKKEAFQAGQKDAKEGKSSVVISKKVKHPDSKVLYKSYMSGYKSVKNNKK